MRRWRKLYCLKLYCIEIFTITKAETAARVIMCGMTRRDVCFHNDMWKSLRQKPVLINVQSSRTPPPPPRLAHTRLLQFKVVCGSLLLFLQHTGKKIILPPCENSYGSTTIAYYSPRQHPAISRNLFTTVRSAVLPFFLQFRIISIWPCISKCRLIQKLYIPRKPSKNLSYAAQIIESKKVRFVSVSQSYASQDFF